MKYIEVRKLRNVVIRLATEHSSMFYFIMEANDNIAFYSTLPFAANSLHRDISVFCTPELDQNLMGIIEHFGCRYPLEIIKDELIEDQGATHL